MPHESLAFAQPVQVHHEVVCHELPGYTLGVITGELEQHKTVSPVHGQAFALLCAVARHVHETLAAAAPHNSQISRHQESETDKPSDTF